MKHIAIVGIDGAGKTTLMNRLGSWLSEECGRSCYFARTDRGNAKVLEGVEAGKGIIFSDSVRLMAYAFDLALKYIQVANMKGIDVVIWDRYTFCLDAYFLALGVDTTQARAVLAAIERPDIVLWLDVDPNIACQRIIKREGKCKPLENEEYLKIVREVYWNMERENSFARIDACLPPDDVFYAAKSIISEKLG